MTVKISTSVYNIDTNIITKYDDIYYQFKKDESDLNEKEDKTEYDSVKEQLTTKQPPHPSPGPYSSHITILQMKRHNSLVSTGLKKQRHIKLTILSDCNGLL